PPQGRLLRAVPVLFSFGLLARTRSKYHDAISPAASRQTRLVGRRDFPGDEAALFLFKGDASLFGDVVQDLLAARGLLICADDRAREKPADFGRLAGGFVHDRNGESLAQVNPKIV